MGGERDGWENQARRIFFFSFVLVHSAIVV